MHLYRNDHADPKLNAQRNLMGRTHYVDDGTLKFHKARILSTYVTDSGLLFALVESVALDPDNRTRGYRHVIFDVFGHVISRVDLDKCHTSRRAAEKAMLADLNSINAKKITRDAINAATARHKAEMAELRKLAK